MRPDQTPEYVAVKREQARKAVMWRNQTPPVSFRAIAKRLRYANPQSIVELIKNYGDED